MIYKNPQTQLTINDIVEIHTITSDTFDGYYNISRRSDENVKMNKKEDLEFEDYLWMVDIYVTNKKINNSLYIEYEFEPDAREEQLKELDKFIHSIRIDEETNY